MTYPEVQQRVYALVADIPPGRVATYGQLAMMIGAPALPRMVGRAMGQAPEKLPAHRVVGSGGRLAPGWVEHRELLAAEGVDFTPGGNVVLRKYQWKPWAE